ncbi:MAG: glycosyltransferase family 1 protein [Candidatus Moranbacteria bacterium]|nr:glycosyltransferase family 1 protein [Candidatus Moranbacteria bacterium]
MKIGIDIRAIGRQRTGDETYTLNLVKKLLKIDKNNQYFLFTNTKNKKEIEEITDKITDGRKMPANAEIVPVLPAGKLFWTFSALPLKARELELDILHVQYITPLFFIGKTKIVTTVHDLSFIRYAEHIKKSDLLFLKTLIPMSLRRAFRVIGVSDFTKSEILKNYKISKKKIRAVNNGGASDDFLDKAKKSGAKLAVAKPYIFYVGTHQPRKNIPLLIRAFVRMKKERCDSPEARKLKLCLAGKRGGHNYDPKIDEALEEIGDTEDAKYLKYIIFPGYVALEELPHYYKESECFVFPSLYEGFGLPLLEAMETRTPVVCSDIPCFREVAGQAALMFDSKCEKDLANKIFQVIMNNELRNKLIQKGKEKTKEFSWEKCAEETLRVYQEK